MSLLFQFHLHFIKLISIDKRILVSCRTNRSSFPWRFYPNSWLSWFPRNRTSECGDWWSLGSPSSIWGAWLVDRFRCSIRSRSSCPILEVSRPRNNSVGVWTLFPWRLRRTTLETDPGPETRRGLYIRASPRRRFDILSDSISDTFRRQTWIPSISTTLDLFDGIYQLWVIVETKCYEYW